MFTHSIDCSTGRAFGILIGEIQKSNPDWYVFQNCAGDNTCISPGVYALIGASAVLGGVTRMTGLLLFASRAVSLSHLSVSFSLSLFLFSYSLPPLALCVCVCV